MGWIARDSSGSLVSAEATDFNGVPEVHEAETIGIRETLRWVRKLQHERQVTGERQLMFVVVESDCQLVVGAVIAQVPIYSPFCRIIDECRQLVALLNNIKIVFVKRSGNKVADWLARSSIISSGRIDRGLSRLILRLFYKQFCSNKIVIFFKKKNKEIILFKKNYHLTEKQTCCLLPFIKYNLNARRKKHLINKVTYT